MLKNRLLLFAFAILLFHQFASAQNNTNSPFTRFGYGSISDTNNGEQRAMGGVSIGSRNNSSINSVNPASYSCVDSMTFQFDIGTSGIMSHFAEPKGGVTKWNANLEYLTLQFPVTKWLGLSAGVLPYSFVGYDFYNNDSTYINDLSSRDTVAYSKSFNGNGGFSQVYMGLSANLFNHIALGVNAYYMFGSVYNYRNLSFSNSSTYSSTTSTYKITADNFRYRFGAQFYNTFAKKHDLTLGFVFEPKAKLNGKFLEIKTGVLTDTISPDYGFETPAYYGIGLYYTYDKRISVGIDYSMQGWKDTKFMWDPVTSSNKDNLLDRSKIAIGVDFLPNPKGRKYSDRVHYRGGFNLSDNYFNVSGQTLPKNFGLSVGVGLPLRNSSTMLNATFEYSKIGTTALLNEELYKLTFNFTFNEHWFFKRKL